MALTHEEIHLVARLRFDLSIAEFIRGNSQAPLEPLKDDSESEVGLSVAVADGDEAERMMNIICPRLEASGYRAFWSKSHGISGFEDDDEVAILKTRDPFAMVRLKNSDGANYQISTDDILARLAAWESICAFKVVGADYDWVALQFLRLPEKICAFAEEVYAFCPDAVTQGVGLLRESKDPQRFQEARKLCPEVKVQPREMDPSMKQLLEARPEMAEQMRDLLAAAADDGATDAAMGVRLLALEITRKKYLFLWWD